MYTKKLKITYKDGSTEETNITGKNVGYDINKCFLTVWTEMEFDANQKLVVVNLDEVRSAMLE